MDRHTLEEWVRYLPDDAPYFRWLPYTPVPRSSGQDLFLQRIIDEGTCVMDPQFGWRFAKSFAEQDMQLPECITNEEWLLRAHSFMLNRERDPELDTILRLHLTPAWSRHRDIIKAALMCRSVDLSTIATLTAIPENIIYGYDQLFFNVMSRKDEVAYMSHLAYPNGAMIEMMEGYLTNEDSAKIMIRVAFMHDMDSALGVAGMPTEHLSEFEAESFTRRMKSLIMANALQVARMGGLHQPSTPAIHHGRTIITAQEASGKEESSGEDFLTEMSMSGAIMDEVMRARETEKKMDRVIEVDLKLQAQRQQQLLAAQAGT